MINALAAAAFIGAAGTPAGVVPPGTYRYAVRSEGQIRTTSTVVISRDAASVSVAESMPLGGETEHTTRLLDPVTFATRSWTGSSDGSSDTVTVATGSATYRHRGASTTLAAAGNGPAAVFDFMVAEFVTLPAMIHVTGAAHYAEYCVCLTAFEAKSIAVVPASAPRPQAVPAEDDALALTATGETATLWYDPNTFILRELDLAREHISYVLQSSS